MDQGGQRGTEALTFAGVVDMNGHGRNKALRQGKG